ncbi:hypothetical protein HDE_00871 [Halotydeus destructor]|nr:hypothetical protein HDE_00871 [Halotydeus destructor]
MSSIADDESLGGERSSSFMRILLSVEVIRVQLEGELPKIQKKNAFRSYVDISQSTADVIQQVKRMNQNNDLDEIAFEVSKNGHAKQVKVLYPRHFPETLLCMGTLKMKPQHTDFDYKEALQLEDTAGNIDRYFRNVRRCSYQGEPKNYMSVLLGDSCKECTVQRVMRRFTLPELVETISTACYHKMFFVALDENRVQIKAVKGEEQLAVVRALNNILCFMMVPSLCIIPCPGKQFKYGLNPQCIYMIEPSLEAKIRTFIVAAPGGTFDEYIGYRPGTKRKLEESFGSEIENHK